MALGDRGLGIVGLLIEPRGDQCERGLAAHQRSATELEIEGAERLERGFAVGASEQMFVEGVDFSRGNLAVGELRKLL